MSTAPTASRLRLEVYSSEDPSRSSELLFGRNTSSPIPGSNVRVCEQYMLPLSSEFSICTEPLIPVLGAYALHILFDVEDAEPTLEIDLMPVSPAAIGGYNVSILPVPFLIGFQANGGRICSYVPNEEFPRCTRPLFSAHGPAVSTIETQNRWADHVVYFKGMLIRGSYA